MTDYTSIEGLTAFILNFKEAILPIALTLCFIGFLMLLVPQSRQFLGGLFGGKRGTLKIKGLALVLFGIVILMATIAPFMVGASPEAIQVAGNLNVGVTQVAKNSQIDIQAENLAASTAYAIYADSTALINWTTGSSDTVRSYFYTPTSTGTKVIYLYSGATTVDRWTITVYDVATLLPTQLLIGLAVAILIITVIVVAVKRISKDKD